MRTIARSILVLPLTAFALACGTAASDPHEPEEEADEPSLGTPGARGSVTLALELTQTSQNPTPTDLPTEFLVSSPAELERGGTTVGSWSAENGVREPREGTAEMRLGSDGSSVVILLFRQGATASDAEVMKLEGKIEGTRVSGSFVDALYYRRAGLFEAARR